MGAFQDFRFSFRNIRRNPWFSLAIIVTMALGIGVNTTVFTLVNAVLYKPLPFPGGERLVLAFANQPSQRRNNINISHADYLDFRQNAKSFERLEGFSGRPFHITERGNNAERYYGGLITAGLFEMLHVQPVLGRGLSAADEKFGAEAVLLLGYGVWADRYGKDPNVIGRTVRVNDKPAVIVGVMPEGLKFPNNEDMWMAAAPDAQMGERGRRQFMMVGMLRPGMTISDARADLSITAARLAEQYPATHKGYGATVDTFHDVMNGGPIRIVFRLMLGAVGFVLLIACANVANLLLSRAIARSREMAIRGALGASRWSILRKLLVESVMLSAAGGVIGLLLAVWGTAQFDKAVQNVGKPYWIQFTMNYAVFGYFAVITVLAGITFGIAPAIRASRVDWNEALKDGSKGSGSRKGGYLSATLIVFQFTLAVILLSGAGLMIRSFVVAQDEFAALHSERLTHARVNLTTERYPANEDNHRFYEKLLPAIAAAPGVSSVSIVSNPPGMGGSGWRLEISGRQEPEAEQRPAATVIVNSPGYQRQLGIPPIRGREFNDTDGEPGKEAALISPQFVTRFFPNEDPIGKQIRFFSSDGKPKPWTTIIGVVPEVRQSDPSNPANDPVAYLPYRAESFANMAVLVEGKQRDSAAMARIIQENVRQIDETLTVTDIDLLSERMARNRWHLRVFGTLFAIFAAIALGMAAIGIYAVVAQATSRRTQEIGIRMALGADVGRVLRLVIGSGLWQLGLGLALGLGAAFAVTRLMARILFRVSPQDPITFGLVSAVLVSAGLLACWIPARRAARLDPVSALRYE